MARTGDGRTALVEIKAVDNLYPLLGEAVLRQGKALQATIGGEGVNTNGVADPTLFARLNLKPGSGVAIGALWVRLADSLTSEPDKLAGGIGLGPRLMLSLDALRVSGLIQPGSLIRWRYRLLLPADVTIPTAIKQPRPARPFRRRAGRSAPAMMPRRNCGAASTASPCLSLWWG